MTKEIDRDCVQSIREAFSKVREDDPHGIITIASEMLRDAITEGRKYSPGALAYIGETIDAANKAAQELAARDGLTGLFNRKLLGSDLERELSSSFRSGSPFSIAMLDIDHFRDFNENYGHPEGDRVLRGVGEILLAAGRGSDRPYRFGGEEFLFLLPDTPLEGALPVIKGLRDKIREMDMTFINKEDKSEKSIITISAGVVELDREDPLWIPYGERGVRLIRKYIEGHQISEEDKIQIERDPTNRRPRKQAKELSFEELVRGIQIMGDFIKPQLKEGESIPDGSQLRKYAGLHAVSLADKLLYHVKENGRDGIAHRDSNGHIKIIR
jgi:diguanylate cyclase (GGDEF)-like protein